MGWGGILGPVMACGGVCVRDAVVDVSAIITLLYIVIRGFNFLSPLLLIRL